MAKFLFTAQDRVGKSITDRIEAESSHAARLDLERQGYHAIVFHTDELANATTAMALEAIPPDSHPPPLAPKRELEARRLGGIWGPIWFGWKREWRCWVPLLAWNGLSIYRGPPFSTFDWLGFGLSLLFVCAFVWARIPALAYNQLIEASTWCQVGDVRLWTRFLRRFRRLSGVGVPDMELDCRLAASLAREDRLPEAVELFRKHEDNSACKAYYFSRLSEIYTAGRDYAQMNACRIKAVEASDGGLNETIDYAFGLVRRLRNPVAAEQVLNSVPTQDVTDIAQVFVHYCRGLIALEKGDWPVAERQFKSALELGSPIKNALMVGMLIEVKAFLCIALAQQSRHHEAKALLEEATPLLKARGELELLERSQAATGA
jgi:tetratricopeptide (TPR) repeat protein